MEGWKDRLEEGDVFRVAALDFLTEICDTPLVGRRGDYGGEDVMGDRAQPWCRPRDDRHLKLTQK